MQNYGVTGTVSRNKSLKIPRQISSREDEINSQEDRVEIARAVAKINCVYSKEKILEEDKDLDWQRVSKIPESASDLVVITKVKKLGAYIITITEKSPAKFRGVFVNRMQNFCLEALENLIYANFIRMVSAENKHQREKYQTDAIIKLKMLGYIALISESSKCILLKQYKQISMQIGECLNLISAWKKNDDQRWSDRK